MPEIGPEIPRVEELVGEEEEHHHHHPGYGKFVAVATVVTTLIGALVAFAQAGALRTHDKADSRAESYGTLALQASAIARGRADVMINRLNQATEEVRQANSALLFQQYGTASTANRLTAARWTAIAKQTEADSQSIAASEGMPYICSPTIQSHCTAASAVYGPEQDPRFPSRYEQHAQWNAYDLTALRDSSNQAADDAEAEFVHYAAALTMLAVAVFLFGYSLTPQGTLRRRLYSRVAGGLVLVGGVWALVQVLSPVTTPPNSAATAFANGEVALGDGNYRSAIADFNVALTKNPRFVDAYHDRAQAEFGAGFQFSGVGSEAVPTTAGPATIPSTSALQAAISDDKRARDEGSDSATLLLDLGRNLLYHGTITRSQSELSESRTYLRDAVDAFKTQDNASQVLATAELRLAEVDLALGGSAGSTDLAAALHALQAPGVSRERAVAGGLTDLSLIEDAYPKRAAQINAIRDQIVAAGAIDATTPIGKPGKSHATVALSGISVQPDPGHGLYTVSKPGAFDPARDILSAQWEYKDPIHGEWAVLPEMSGPVGPGGLQGFGSTGFASTNSSYVSSSSPATCLPPGKYKVELYVNGRLSGSATGTGAWSSLHAVRLSDVDAAMCVGNDFESFPAGTGADGYITKTGSSGASILSIPKATVPGIASNQQALASLMDTVVKGFAGGAGGLLPGLKSGGAAQRTPFFMSSDNGQAQSWSYNNGTVLSGVGTSSNGDVYIGIAWSPGNGDLANALFLSLSPL